MKKQVKDCTINHSLKLLNKELIWKRKIESKKRLINHINLLKK